MDNLWERSVAFYNIDEKQSAEIFKGFDKKLEIINLIQINIGCRNSNYKIVTSKGSFLLRICAKGEQNYKKEKCISELFGHELKIPELLFVEENDKIERTCLIYEFVDGNSMQEVIIERGKLEDKFLEQVATSAACIHRHEDDSDWEFETLKSYPPFINWYDLFLEGANVAERLGHETIARVKSLVADKKSDLNEIDKYISFIHADFRPANMLVDKNNKVWIVDWEFAGFGHSLADIGQFFRYSSSFQNEQINKFEDVYNSFSKRKLPENWYELSKLRELINPLQMLGGKEMLPRKYEDLKSLILQTLDWFGY